MKLPFEAQCLEVVRKGYISKRLSNKRKKHCEIQVEPTLCQNKIWFEQSLKEDYAIGKCPVKTHNPVYRKIETR